MSSKRNDGGDATRRRAKASILPDSIDESSQSSRAHRTAVGVAATGCGSASQTGSATEPLPTPNGQHFLCNVVQYRHPADAGEIKCQARDESWTKSRARCAVLTVPTTRLKIYTCDERLVKGTVCFFGSLLFARPSFLKGSSGLEQCK